MEFSFKDWEFPLHRKLGRSGKARGLHFFVRRLSAQRSFEKSRWESFPLVDMKCAIAVVLFGVLAAGCGVDPDDPSSTDMNELDARESAIIDGKVLPFDQFSEIGVYYKAGDRGRCTATLISPNVAITAAHCVDYRSGKDYWGWLKLFAWGKQFDYTVVEVRSLGVEEYREGGGAGTGSRPGNADIALLRLNEDVPELVATPRPVTNEDRIGDGLVVVGFGCSDGATGEGGGWKRGGLATLTGYGPLLLNIQTCPGDSGGPMFYGSTGAIYGVVSYYQGYSTLAATPKHVWADYQFWAWVLTATKGS